MTMGAFVTLTVAIGRRAVSAEMPSATTATYAAKRLAEAAGMDPDQRWVLLRGPRERLGPIEDGALASDLVGEQLFLGLETEE